MKRHNVSLMILMAVSICSLFFIVTQSNAGNPGAIGQSGKTTTEQLKNGGKQLPPGAVPNPALSKTPLRQSAKFSYRISGILGLENCSTSMPITFMINGRQDPRAHVTMNRVGGEFSTRSQYTIELSDFPEGPVEFGPQLDRSEHCGGGHWTPTTRRVSLTGANLSVPLTGQDFKYVRQIVTRRIPTSLLTSAVQGLFIGTRIHLNNWKRVANWPGAEGVPNDAFIRFGEGLGNIEVRFDIPESRSHPYVYYVNDINLRNITAGVEGEYFKLTFFLEDSGTEFRGFCYSKANLLCKSGGDSSAPDIEMNNAKIEVLLKPVGYFGDLTFGEVNVRMTADIRAHGVAAGLDLLPIGEAYKRSIRAAFERSIRQVLNTDSVRRMVSNEFRPILTSQGVGTIQTVELSPSYFTVSYFPAVSGR
jgi:hypothetical protein